MKGSVTAFDRKILPKHPLVATHQNERLSKRDIAQGQIDFFSPKQIEITGKISLFYSYRQHMPQQKQRFPKFYSNHHSVKANPEVKLLILLRWFGNFSTLERRHDIYSQADLLLLAIPTGVYSALVT